MDVTKFCNSILVAGTFLTALCGCGSSNSNAPGSPHATAWETPVSHGLQYTANPVLCSECHGQDFTGGISKTSCNTACHVHVIPAGYSDWATAHGKQAKGKPTITPGNIVSGFLSCQYCHGRDNKGTALSQGQGCINISCHQMASYTNLPPHSGFWNDKTNFIGATHFDVYSTNAAGCAACHERDKKTQLWYKSVPGNPYKLYSTKNMLTPPAGASVGTTPSCFNNTLCHGPK